MEPFVVTKGRYAYVHDVKKGPTEAVDVHRIMVVRIFSRGFVVWTYPLLFAIVGIFVFLLLQNSTSVFQVLMLDKPIASVIWSFTLAGFLFRQLLRKQVEKESVVIFPAFGVQLETTYRSYLLLEPISNHAWGGTTFAGVQGIISSCDHVSSDLESFVYRH